jgi:methionyl-tRNA synthetase
MPESAQKIWNQMGFDGNVSDFSWKDMSDLGISPGHILGDASPLFARVEASDIENHKKELGPSSN